VWAMVHYAVNIRIRLT